jgi:hypothetical protein
MTKNQLLVLTVIGLVGIFGCKEKKPSEDIITVREEIPAPSGPVRMQSFNNQRVIQWLGKEYHVEITRTADDSLRMVTDETGQKYVDNVFRLKVSRQDGSVFFSRTFTKKSLTQYLDDDFNKTGVFEGLVLDKAEGDFLIFGASVGHPQSDEYIPLVFKLSRMGDLSIKRDTQMDNPPADKDEETLR